MNGALPGISLTQFALAARAGVSAPAGSTSEFRAAWEKLADGASMGLRPGGGGWVQFAPEIKSPGVSPVQPGVVPILATNPVPIPGIMPNPQPNSIPWIPPQGAWNVAPVNPVITVPLATGTGMNLPGTIPGNPPSPRAPSGPFGMPGQLLPVRGLNPFVAPGVSPVTWQQVAQTAGILPTVAAAGAAGAGASAGAATGQTLSLASALDPKNLLKYGMIVGGMFILYSMGKHNSPGRRAPRRRRRAARR